MTHPPSPTRTVCLQDIADKAKVSRATVSLALRNHASIPSQTRARIQEVAAFLDYRPNPLVSALMTYQRITKPMRNTHMTLAMVLPSSRNGAGVDSGLQRDRAAAVPASGSWRSFMSESLLQSATLRAEQHGYHLEEFWLEDLNLRGPRLDEVLYARCIPGVIVAPLPSATELDLDWSRYSAVAIGNALPLPRLHRVRANSFDAMRGALRRLRRLGYQRIGLAIKASHDACVDGVWSAVFLSEQQTIPNRHRVAPFIVRDPCWTERNFAQWYETRQPDVVMGIEGEIVPWIENLGRRVPDDVGFVQLAIQDESLNHTGIQPPPALGSAAVDQVVEMIRRNERGVPASPQTVLLETGWMDGGTIRQSPKTCVASGRAALVDDLGFGKRAVSRGRFSPLLANGARSVEAIGQELGCFGIP